MKQRVSKVLAVMMVAVLMITGKADAATIAQGQHTIEHLDNGDYIETVINDAGMKAALSLQSADKQITKTKTAYYKNQSGAVLWSVSIKATFSYNGTSSKCISCSPSASAPAKSWSIKSLSSSKKGNSASAKVVAVHATNVSQQYTKTVTIHCSKTGVIS